MLILTLMIAILIELVLFVIFIFVSINNKARYISHSYTNGFLCNIYCTDISCDGRWNNKCKLKLIMNLIIKCGKELLLTKDPMISVPIVISCICVQFYLLLIVLKSQAIISWRWTLINVPIWFLVSPNIYVIFSFWSPLSSHSLLHSCEVIYRTYFHS